MNNLVILPILIPLLCGILFILVKEKIMLQKVLSVLTLLGVLIISGILIHQVQTNGIQVLNLGGWPAPFGIVLVADMFSILLVLTAAIVSLACLLFAFQSIGKPREKVYFYAFFMFLITGVNGSFLTGDIFNLFVFFEVMLIASYIMISLGGENNQLRESLKYVLINIVSSALFVAAVAYLLATAGTLNMAHLSLIVAELGQHSLFTVIALLFLIVFSIKAALFLYFWLPGAYSAPPFAVQALFAALLTKVGIYAIYRLYTLIFYHHPEVTHVLLGWLAIITIILGVSGAISSWDVQKILLYNVVATVGFIILGLAVFTETALAGGVFYLLHDMVIKGVLFMLGGCIFILTGTTRLKQMGGLMRNHPLLGWMLFVAGLALAGVPPFSGFIGKLLILRGSIENEWYFFVAIAILSSLLILYSLLKIFMTSFWGEQKLATEEEKGSTKKLIFPCALLILLSIAMGLGVEWIYPYIDTATKALLDPAVYIQSVLKE